MTSLPPRLYNPKHSVNSRSFEQIALKVWNVFSRVKRCADENDLLIERTHLDSDEESTTTRNDALRERERESLGIYPSPCFSKLAC